MYTILVVDDDKFSLAITMKYIQESGVSMHILHATNGRLACRVTEVSKPDLIIMDWEMPEMSGIQAISYLKCNPETSDIPIIMTTAHTSSDYIRKAFAAGAIDYVRKPIDKVELMARMNSAIALTSSYKEIQEQKKVIEIQNDKIIKGIEYAYRIQTAMHQPIEEIRKYIPDFFVLYKPKEIVSGDFFWFSTLSDADGSIGNKLIIAAADCTGHGVPGGFLAMLGNSLLHQIVNTRNIRQPDLILNELHRNFKKTLYQEQNDNDDGMTISICTIDRLQKTIEFAGSESPFVYFQHGKMFRIEGDETSIGGMQFEENPIFTKHCIDISTPTMVFLFSDGYQDQFERDSDKKFLVMRFMKLLGDISLLPVEEQRLTLNKKIDDWMGDKQYQTDDIMVLGFRL